MPDTQIHPTGTVSVPADYRIPESAELLLKNAYAHFDGSGAAGSYLPLIRIISDAGSTVVEAVSDTTIAAGASADASWFPHLAAASSASAGTTPVVAIGVTSLVTVPTVAAGGTSLVTFSTVGSSDTSKAYWAASQGTPPTAAPPRIWLHFKSPAKGTVWVQASCIWPAGTKIDSRIFSPNGFDIPHDGWDSFSGYDAAAVAADGPQLMDATYMSFNVSNADVPIAVRLTNSDAVASAPESVQLCAIYWPDLYTGLS